MVAQGWVIAAVCAAVVIITLALLVVWLVRRNGRQSDELNAAHAGRADAEAGRADAVAARMEDAHMYVAAQQDAVAAVTRYFGKHDDQLAAALAAMQSVADRAAVLVAMREREVHLDRNRDNGTE